MCSSSLIATCWHADHCDTISGDRRCPADAAGSDLIEGEVEDAGTLTVRRALAKVDGSWQIVEPKTEARRRTIDVDTSTTAALRRHR